MATAVTISRYAADDRRGAANSSPFRSVVPMNRYIAALEMRQKREKELAGLEEILAKTADVKTQRVIAQRIRATKNNLQSWIDYLDQHTPREPRAVITPRSKA